MIVSVQRLIFQNVDQVAPFYGNPVPQNMEDLKNNIRQVVAEIPFSVIRGMFENLRERYEKCLQVLCELFSSPV